MSFLYSFAFLHFMVVEKGHIFITKLICSYLIGKELKNKKSIVIIRNI